jgi:hypothetical protein
MYYSKQSEKWKSENWEKSILYHWIIWVVETKICGNKKKIPVKKEKCQWNDLYMIVWK